MLSFRDTLSISCHLIGESVCCIFSKSRSQFPCQVTLHQSLSVRLRHLCTARLLEKKKPSRRVSVSVSAFLTTATAHHHSQIGIDSKNCNLSVSRRLSISCKLKQLFPILLCVGNYEASGCIFKPYITLQTADCQITESDVFIPHLYLQNRRYSKSTGNVPDDDKVNSPRLPKLNEDELEEKFVRGGGPGGQAVNKTSNCVMLRHLPTGIIVKCHAERSLELNRKIARKRMRLRLDDHFNGENSQRELKKQEARLKKAKKKAKTKKKLERLAVEREAMKSNDEDLGSKELAEQADVAAVPSSINSDDKKGSQS